MSTSKRSNASRYNNSRSTAGRDAARNVGVVLGLGGLSFFLGFFVLARMVPDRQNESGQTGASAAQKVSPASNTQAAQTAALPSPSPPPTESIAAAAPRAVKKRDASSDITIEPGDETASQKPKSLDDTADKSGADAGVAKAPVNSDTESAGRKPANDAITPTTGVDGENAERPASPAPARRRTRGHSADSETDASATAEKTDTGGIREGEQKPASIDRDETASSARAEKADRPARTERRRSRSDQNDTANTDEEAPKSVKPVSRARYRVAAGAYSRREAAERAAQKVTDLGLEATVVPVTKEDGTTVYRVQQGIYRLRANANAAKQKLSDAGLDADVVKTGG